jgi:hypothetical protein
MQNKQRLELADYEAENLARLQKTFARKWEFVFMQAEAQAKYVVDSLTARNPHCPVGRNTISSPVNEKCLRCKTGL